MGGAHAPTGSPPPSGRGLPALSRFDVVRRIGEGGTGLVYEAIDRTSGERVALKMLRIADPDTLLRLKQEFRSLSHLEHPNLVRLGELLCDGGVWFFTMELVEGATFLAYTAGDRPGPDDPDHSVVRFDARARSLRLGEKPAPSVFDEGRLRASLAQLVRGLVALHSAGKVHRDIKPSNVLVTREGRVVILDFGLVRDAVEPAEDDGVVGTISHMAPEQAAGGEVGPPADWYSVGAVLYQCLTGRPPFQGGASDVLRKKQCEDPHAPSAIAAGVPRDLEALCVELLRREPGARPTGGDALRRLEPRHADPPPRRGSIPPARAPFVGRSRELEVLTAAFARVRAGEPATALVEGESGVGKSALVRRFARGLGGDVLVLSGRCYEREDVPYKAIDGVIDALVHHLASLSPTARAELVPPSATIVAQAFPVLWRVLADAEAPPSVGPQGARSALYAAMRDLFGRVARARPLVVTIDDLQWADADGLALLGELLRPPAAPPMLVVTTARASAEQSASAPYGMPGGVRVVPLGRLGPDESMELARMLLEEPNDARAADAALAREIAAEAGGHPMFLDELVRHALLHGGRVTHVQLDDALYARSRELDRPARELLEVLAVGGGAIAPDVAMRAANLAPADFARVVQTLRAANLARAVGARGEESIEPYHDRVREAVAARLDPEVRRAWHLGLARSLESAKEVDADALSTHWLGAGRADKAAEYARRAAEHAFEAFAFERAARLFERALALGSAEDAARQTLRIRRAESLASAGLGAQAAKGFADAAREAAPADALDLRRRAAEELLVGGRLDEGNDMLREVLRAVGIGLPMTSIGALASLLVYRLILWVRGGGYQERDAHSLPALQLTRHEACGGVARALALVDTVRGAYFQTRTLVFALALGEPSRVARALAMEAAQLSTAGPRMAARSARLLAQAAAVAQRSGDAETIALQNLAHGFVHLTQGHFRDSLESFDRGAHALRGAGTFWYLRSTLFGSIWSLGWLGELERLSSRVDREVREAEHRGDLYAATTLRTGIPNLTWLRRGDAQEARAIALDATRSWTQRGYHNQHYWSLLALANIDLYEGDGRAAHARVSREWGRLDRALILKIQVVAIEAIHLRARAALAAARDERGGHRARLLRAASRDARRLEHFDTPMAQPFAQLVHAGVAAMRGDLDRASFHLGAAVDGYDAGSMALHASAARWQLGRLRAGDAGRALALRAEAWMTEQGVASAPSMARMIAPGFR